jgi:outer membrane protein OmpA-like peptidoglycan-associated protein
MRCRFALAMAAAGLAACGWFGRKEDARGTSAGSGVQGSGRVAPGPSGPTAGAGAAAAAGAAAPWSDPEPPGAQGIAEQAVSAPWNQDKVTPLTASSTTTLMMGITTLVDTKTGLEGFRTALAPTATTLDQRLTRLGAEVTGTEITIRLPGSVLFDFDSAQIRPDAERTLAEVAEVIKGYPGRPVRIEGHTDSVASDDYNQKLSERRAASVRAWLAAKRVEGSRLTPRGFGETKPVADNGTAEGRQRNRRVEVIIEKGH